MNSILDSAIQAKAGAETDLLKLPGVTAVDVGYKYVNGKRTDQIAVRVHVAKKKKNVDKKDMIPAEINGVKTDVIEGTYEPYVVSKKKIINVDTQAVDTTKYRPLQGGISIGPDRSVGGYIFAGTLGCMVKDNSSGKIVMLSNFHVMCIDNNWHVGDQQDQPSLIDTGTNADGVGTLLRAVLSSHVDGAIASINTGIATQASVVGIGNVAGTTAAVLGSAVRKKGRTTGLTYGTIDGLNGSVNVNYGGTIGTKTLTDQLFIVPDTTQNAMFSDHGDSGSVIMDSTNHVVGLLFAGDTTRTIANMIANVESELNITVSVPVIKIIEHKHIIKDKDIKTEKIELKEHKIEKLEIKELKHEKVEIKEHKAEKFEHKEIKEIEKHIEKNFDNPGGPVQLPGGPIQLPGGGGIGQGADSSDLEQRIAQLESSLYGLTVFIDANLRPDLSKGGLANE